jgi:integrase
LRAYKLTPAFVRRVATEQPPARPTYFGDQSLPRHYIYVRPPSRPGGLWPVDSRIRYTLPNGRRRWMVVGDPRTMSLDALRTAARAALAIVDKGDDPAAERASRRAAWTVRDLWEHYSASPEIARCTPASRAAITSGFTAHILPRIGAQLLTAIDVPMVRRLMHAITTDSRTFRRNLRLGGAGAARKTAHTLSTAISWAVSEGQIERNPLKGALRIGADGVRETVITDPQQYARLFSAMDAMVAGGKLRPTVRAFIICAALTGARRGELQQLTWGQVDLAGRRVVLADTKGSKLMKKGGVKTEVLSLPPLVAAALSAIMLVGGDAAADTLVFPPIQGERIYVGADWRRIRATAGLPPDLTLHGLRHSIGTAAVLAGLSAPEVQALLRHRNASTSNKYIHLADQHRARLQDRVAATLLPDTSPAAEVHQLPAVRKHG